MPVRQDRGVTTDPFHEVQAASLDNLDLTTAGCLDAEEVLARLRVAQA